MKLARIKTARGRTGWGWVDPEDARLIHEPVGLSDVFSPDRVLADSIAELAANLPGADRHTHKLEELQLLAPIASPSKIIAVGRNYREHAAESGSNVPEAPMLFGLFPSAITGPFDPVYLPAESAQIDWEGELGVVIGRECRSVERGRALDVIAGYVVVNDVSARDLQRKDGQWTRAKSFDTFKPMGPYLTTADELGLAADLNISVKVNGVQKQNASTAMMVFPVDELVEYISAFCTLLPGDIIATGTPSGVGMGETPQCFLKAGDLVETEVQGIGRMANRMVASPALAGLKAEEKRFA